MKHRHFLILSGLLLGGCACDSAARRVTALEARVAVLERELELAKRANTTPAVEPVFVQHESIDLHWPRDLHVGRPWTPEPPPLRLDPLNYGLLRLPHEVGE